MTCYRSIGAGCCVLVTVVLCTAVPCIAQEQPAAHEGWSLVAQIAKDTATNPTSYVPATLLYTASRLDWSSSQTFFQHGALENNARYTISGLPHDIPLSDSAGNRQILSDSLQVLLISFANNALTSIAQHVLSQRDPAHYGRWRRLARIERVAVAAALSFALSSRHIQQWQQNDQRASQLGY